MTHGGLSTREEMCLGFVLYYPRQQLADCRSLPAPRTLTAALGVNTVFGRSLDKLTEFLGDIGGAGKTSSPAETETLSDLLNILAAETGNEHVLRQAALGGAQRQVGPFIIQCTPESTSHNCILPLDILFDSLLSIYV